MISKLLKKNVGLLALSLSVGMILFAADEETKSASENVLVSVSSINNDAAKIANSDEGCQDMRFNLKTAAIVSLPLTLLGRYFCGTRTQSIVLDCVPHILMATAYAYPTLKFKYATKKYEEVLTHYDVVEIDLEKAAKNKQILDTAACEYEKACDANSEGIFMSHLGLLLYRSCLSFII